MFFAVALADVDPWNLAIGAPGQVTVRAGYTRASDGAGVSLAEIGKAGAACRYVLVGESHPDAEHHRAQAAIIEAVAATGRDVVVGFEMFTRDNQKNIDPFTTGRISDAEFQQTANWKTQWGYDYNLYKPVFDVIRARHLRMAALNVPRDWVRQVGRKGPDALTADQRTWVPGIDTKNADHRAYFTAMMGGHPDMPPGQFENMYAAQVTWDTGMAKSAKDFMSWRGNSTMVILAGSGHVAYGQGIAYRLAQMGETSRLLVVCLDKKPGDKVSKGVGEYLFVAPPHEDPAP
ncbi:MAG: ChaN family lipoprotein [Fimbriimonadaceae bacterium]|nr:ChaN family lipoprotein [Fimbriimonadaceae bacterium]